MLKKYLKQIIVEALTSMAQSGIDQNGLSGSVRVENLGLPFPGTPQDGDGGFKGKESTKKAAKTPPPEGHKDVSNSPFESLVGIEAIAGLAVWKEINEAYLSLLNQILGQAQVINYQYRRLAQVEGFIKALKERLSTDAEQLEDLELLVTDYGLDAQLFSESYDPFKQ